MFKLSWFYILSLIFEMIVIFLIALESKEENEGVNYLFIIMTFPETNFYYGKSNRQPLI